MLKPSLSLIFLRGMMGVCPHCGVGRIFDDFYSVREHCLHCGLPFNEKPGDFTGAAYINSGLSGLVVVLFGLVAVLFSDISVVVLSLIAVPLTIVVASLFHRPIRGGWVALLYYTEAVQPPANWRSLP